MPVDSDESELPGTLVPTGRASDEAQLAIYVADDQFGGQRLLPRSGRIVFGRSPDADVILGGPLVSRHHAALELGSSLVLHDLGSANGTFVGDHRLPSRGTRTIDCNETFFIGGIPVVVRRSALPPPSGRRLLLAGELPEFLRQHAHGSAGLAMVRLRPRRRLEPRWIEPLLAAELRPEDRALPGPDHEIAVFLPETEAAHAGPRARAFERALRNWSIDAATEVVHVPPGDNVVEAASRQVPWLDVGRDVHLAGGALVLRDPAMERIVRVIERVARADVPILVLGETGVGKEMMASLVHERSGRSGPFLRLNCATLSETLLESELFGYERGAFTGAASAKTGLLESANGGTVFLDEIGEIAPSMQARLLRAIETKEVTRVGALKPRSVDVRFVAATNRDLEADVVQGRFRRDLFYRINAVTVHVPPLRERPSEVAALAEQFLRTACRRFGTGPLTLAPSAIAALQAHDWPGNVRELRNTIERAALLAADLVIAPQDLRLGRLADGLDEAPVAMGTFQSEVASTLDIDGRQRDAIADALLRCGGNQSRAAEMLNIPRRTFVRRLSELNIPRPRK